MPNPLSLMVMHRHRLFRESLVAALSRPKQFNVIDMDHTVPDPLAEIIKERPDLVLIDLNLQESMAVRLTQEVRRQIEETKVLLLVSADAKQMVIDSVEAGAHGCVSNDASFEDLLAAIDAISKGKTYCSPEIVHSMMRQLAQLAKDSQAAAAHAESAEVTDRELEIIQLISEGLSNKQIARDLELSLYTVKNHVHNILDKLGVRDRREAVSFAVREGWIKQPTG